MTSLFSSLLPPPTTLRESLGHLSSMKKLHLGSLRGDPPARVRGAKPPPAAIYGSTPESSEGLLDAFSLVGINLSLQLQNGVPKLEMWIRHEIWAGRYSPIVQGRGFNLQSFLPARAHPLDVLKYTGRKQNERKTE